MTERQEEQLTLHALSTLTAEEVRLLESEWRYVARLREEYAEFQDAAAHMALLLPAESPPPECRAELMNRLKQHRRAASPSPLGVVWHLVRHPVVAWAAAAVIAVGAFMQWSQKRHLAGQAQAVVAGEAAARSQVEKAKATQAALEKQLAEANAKYAGLSAELERARENYSVSRMEVAMLKSSQKKYEEGVVLVVWNQEKQEGLLRMEHMPLPQPKKDYQLWVLCRQQPAPVNAGVVKVDERGVARVIFRPVKHIEEAIRFAISLETEGGVLEKPADSPIVLAGR